MSSTPAGVAQVVLHVANDRVLPVEKINGPVRSDADIRRSKVRIGREHDRLDFLADKARILVLDLVLEDALEADNVGYQQIALHFIGKMPAGKVFHAGTGTGFLLIDLRRLPM